MNNAVTELAKMLKERENIRVQGIGIGKVVGIKPITINFNGFILSGSRIVVAKHLTHLYDTTGASVGDHGTHTHIVSDPLRMGENVIVVPTIDNGIYFVIDKVG